MSIKKRFEEIVEHIVRKELNTHKKYNHQLVVQDGEYKISDPITIGYSKLFAMILDELGMDLVYVRGTPPSIEMVKKTS